MAARSDNAASSRVGGEGTQALAPHAGGDGVLRSSPPLKRKRTEAHGLDAEEEVEEEEEEEEGAGGSSAKQPNVGGAPATDLEKDLFGDSEVESSSSSDEDGEAAAKAKEGRRPAKRGGASVPGAGGGEGPEEALEGERSESGGGGGRRDGSEKPSDAEDNAVPDGAQGDVNLAELFGSDEEEVSGPEEAGPRLIGPKAAKSRGLRKSRGTSPNISWPISVPRIWRITRQDTQTCFACASNPCQLHFMRLPKFISVAAKGFDEDTYEEEPAAEAEEQRRLDKFLLEKTIRYRVQGGQAEICSRQRAESNARFVRWSDGSLSLLLGSEMFDLTQEDYKSQKQYLAVDHPGEHILQVQAKFTDSLKFAQHPISGIYAALSAAVEDSKKRRGGIKLIQTLVDPELEKLQAQQ
ncbi:MAG: Leo1-like protein-domain-containing protein, partial [Olpidium bornovanus]